MTILGLTRILINSTGCATQQVFVIHVSDFFYYDWKHHWKTFTFFFFFLPMAWPRTGFSMHVFAYLHKHVWNASILTGKSVPLFPSTPLPPYRVGGILIGRLPNCNFFNCLETLCSLKKEKKNQCRCNNICNCLPRSRDTTKALDQWRKAGKLVGVNFSLSVGNDREATFGSWHRGTTCAVPIVSTVPNWAKCS